MDIEELRKVAEEAQTGGNGAWQRYRDVTRPETVLRLLDELEGWRTSNSLLKEVIAEQNERIKKLDALVRAAKTHEWCCDDADDLLKVLMELDK